MKSTAPGTLGILLVTCIVSLLGLYGRPQLIERSLFRPYELVRNNRYYTLVSSGLVHGSFTHLLFNMLTFYFFGPPLERVVGTAQFVLLYFVGLILSEARTYLQHRNDPRYAALGASGAVSAVLFASIVFFPGQSIFILPLPVPIPAPLFAIGYLLYSWYLSRHARDNINHTAHIDGAVTGLLFVAIFYPEAYGRLLAMYR
ncbi:MAG: rhomboid family intramembrane serine protease [Steroidobacteraceae bacterium]